MKSLPLSGEATPLVFSMQTRQSGTRSDGEVISHVSSISVPPAKESRNSVARARSKASGEASEFPSFTVVIVVLGATRRIGTYDCRPPCTRCRRLAYLRFAVHEYRFEGNPSPAARERVPLSAVSVTQCRIELLC